MPGSAQDEARDSDRSRTISMRVRPRPSTSAGSTALPQPRVASRDLDGARRWRSSWRAFPPQQTRTTQADSLVVVGSAAPSSRGQRPPRAPRRAARRHAHRRLAGRRKGSPPGREEGGDGAEGSRGRDSEYDSGRCRTTAAHIAIGRIGPQPGRPRHWQGGGGGEGRGRRRRRLAEDSEAGAPSASGGSAAVGGGDSGVSPV